MNPYSYHFSREGFALPFFMCWELGGYSLRTVRHTRSEGRPVWQFLFIRPAKKRPQNPDFGYIADLHARAAW